MSDKQYLKGKMADNIVAMFILLLGIIMAAASVTFLPVLSLSFSVPLSMLGAVMIVSPHTSGNRVSKKLNELKTSEFQPAWTELEVDETYYLFWV